MAAGALVALSRTTPLVLLVVLGFFDTPLANPLRLIRTFTLACALPAYGAWLWRRWRDATLTIDAGTLVVDRHAERVEIPRDAVTEVVPWRVPLPAPGFALRMRSGRAFRWGFEPARPLAIVDAIARARGDVRAPLRRKSPLLAYAEAKHAAVTQWDHPLLQYVVFALVPTLPLFRLNQWIAYGGTFGEYYLFGLQAYVLAFAIYWATLAIYLVLYAAALRAIGEALALAAAWRAPSRAPTVRRRVERIRRILFYGGVPVALVWIFLLRG